MPGRRQSAFLFSKDLSYSGWNYDLKGVKRIRYYPPIGL